MSNLTTFTNSIDTQLIKQNSYIIPMNNFVFAEQLSVNVLRHYVELLVPKFPIPPQNKIYMYTISNSFNCSLHNHNWAYLPPEWKQTSFTLSSSQQQQATIITSKRNTDFFIANVGNVRFIIALRKQGNATQSSFLVSS